MIDNKSDGQLNRKLIVSSCCYVPCAIQNTASLQGEVVFSRSDIPEGWIIHPNKNAWLEPSQANNAKDVRFVPSARRVMGYHQLIMLSARRAAYGTDSSGWREIAAGDSGKDIEREGDLSYTNGKPNAYINLAT